MTRLEALCSARDALWAFASQGCDDANEALPIIETMIGEMVDQKSPVDKALTPTKTRRGIHRARPPAADDHHPT